MHTSAVSVAILPQADEVVIGYSILIGLVLFVPKVFIICAIYGMVSKSCFFESRLMYNCAMKT